MLDQPCGGFVGGIGGTPYGGDGRFELRNVCTGVECLDCLVEIAAGPAEPASAVEQGCDDFAFVGDLGAGAVEVAGGGERGAGEEPGDGQIALGGSRRACGSALPPWPPVASRPRTSPRSRM
ncbi:hypothetical protein [Streptomyces cahuitamycinicus]|uniref:hypothetical protein n=1 Tax=Streptomyces cahuitamycinicus TaxID=2070367 RepID=UPI001FECDF90|nr:hypothetical protein [Streptomyces cahuitamycinicus]